MKKGILFALITAVAFVTVEPVSKLIAESVTPYAITFWRFFLGAFMLVPMAAYKIKKENIRITLKELGIISVLGVLFICVSMILIQIAIKEADTPSLIAIIFSSNSIFTIVFAVMMIKEERFTKNKVIALIIGVIGVLACADFNAKESLRPVILGVLSAVTFSLYTVLCRKYLSRVCGLVQSAGAFLSGSIILLIILLTQGVNVAPSFAGNDLLILLYLALVTGIGYACYFMAIEKGGAIMASLAFFIKPVLTPFVTLFVNGIAPDIKVFFAVACIVAASYFAVYKKA